MGRAPCCEKVGLKKGRWTAEEDQILTSYIQQNGEGKWRSLPKNAGLLRCGKSCRLRWINYLRADVKRGNITKEEEETIVKLHSSIGNRWSVIAAQLPGRTDNEIKNYWNSHLSRKIYTFRRSSSFDSSVSSTASSSSSTSTTTATVDDASPNPAAARSSRKRKKALSSRKLENPSRKLDEKSAAPLSGITTSAGEQGSEGDGGGGDLGVDGGELMMELDGNVEFIMMEGEEEEILGTYEWLDSEMNRLKSKLRHCAEDGGGGGEQGKATAAAEDLTSGEMKNGGDSEMAVVESERNKGIESSSSSASNSNDCNCEHHDQGEEEWLDWDQITGGDEIQNIHWDEGDSSILSWLLDGNEQLQ